MDYLSFLRFKKPSHPSHRCGTGLRESPGFVKNHVVHPSQGFEDERILEVDPQSPQHPLGRSQREGRGQRQRARTGNDEDRHQRLHSPDTVTKSPPGQCGTHGDHQEEQRKSATVGLGDPIHRIVHPGFLEDLLIPQ